MKWKNILNNQKGSSMVMAAFVFIAILGCAALITDIGMLYLHRQRLSNAVDAAALAAVQDITQNSSIVKETAEQYMQHNGFSGSNIQVTLATENNSVEIRGTSTIQFYFARVLGFDSTQVNVTAKAKALPISGMTGLRPLAVEDFPLEYGKQYILKEGAGDSYNGNFGIVALGGTGTSIYRNNLKYGYAGKIRVGDWVDTETGNMPNPTQEGIDYLMNQCSHSPKCTIDHYHPECSRLIPLPVVESLQVDGRKDVKIIGFAMFLLEGYQMSGGHLDVIGRFVRHYGKGEADGSGKDYGLKAVKLVE